MGALVNELTWSKSRDSLFRECRRAYYLHHYGAWGGWERGAAPETRALYVMKNLQTRATWIGSAVHDVAERAIKAIQRGRPLDKDATLARLKARLHQDLKDSEAGRYLENPKRSLGLTAHYYEVDADQGELEASIELGLSCAATFFDSRAYRRVLAVGSAGILSVEDLEHFEVGGVKVWVKLDLSMRGKDGGVVIVDWKTGKHHDPEDVALQLGIYGLYGVRSWGLGPEQIVAFDVNLRDDSLTTHPIDAAKLLEVEGYIEASIAAMREALDDPAANAASQDAFPLTEDLWKCRRCRFRRACDREGV